MVFLAVAPALLVSLALLGSFTYARLTEQEERLTERGLDLIRHLAHGSEYALFSGNRQQLREAVGAALRERDVVAVSVTAADGVELARGGEHLSSESPVRPNDVRVTPEGIRVEDCERGLVFSAAVMPHPLSVDDYAQAGPTREAPLGQVRVSLSRASTLARQHAIVRDSILISLAVLALTVWSALRFGRGIVRPILGMNRTVGRIGAGHLESRVEGGMDAEFGEFGELKAGINAMAERIQQSHEHMRMQIMEATAKLSHQASHDSLTGLMNRHEFEQRLGRALESARLHAREHALCFMDLDQFKQVNDSCGHGAGDELLRQLTALLTHEVRDRDALARVGGDEFALLLENCPMERGMALADRLREIVRAFRFAWDGQVFNVGASIGMVRLDPGLYTVAEALAAADAACYAAKSLGRNRIHVYHASDEQLARLRGEATWPDRLREAMAHDRFVLHGQRIVPLGAGEMHVEVLLRLADGEDGAEIMPMAFIPAAERFSLMPALDRWVLERLVTHHAALFRDAGMTHAVNLSGASLSDPTFHEFAAELLARHPQAARRLVFEITETAAITNMAMARGFIERLRALGCRFALDDFGSGLSSLNYLKNLRVDYLKIDGGFVRDLGQDAMSEAIIDAIVRIGRVMGLKTVAECVESEQTLEVLRKLGVDYAQGHHLHRPEPLRV
jgi:diguanylate cyclase (GGDEF)-like protein